MINILRFGVEYKFYHRKNALMNDSSQSSTKDLESIHKLIENTFYILRVNINLKVIALITVLFSFYSIIKIFQLKETKI